MVRAYRMSRAIRLRHRVGIGRPPLQTILLFVGPALLLYVIIFLYPIITAFANSFFRWEGIARGPFVGIDNYKVLFSLQPYAEQFFNALSNNFIFFIGTMVAQNGVGLLLALAVNRSIRGRRLFQTIFAMPYLMSALVIGYAWGMILSPQFGALNSILRGIGLEGHAWLGDPSLTMPILIIINAWQWCGAPMLIFGAALAGVSEEHIEAAQLDGARYWRVVRSVQLPQIIPAFSIVTILTAVGTFNLFDLVYAIGGSSGGPAGAGDVLGTLFYRISFGNDVNSIGLSGALSLVQFAIIMAVTIAIQQVLAAANRRYT